MSPRPRRIGLNGLFLDYPHSGTWTYTRNLVPAVAALDPGTQYELALRYGTVDPAPAPNLRLRKRWWPARHPSSRSAIARLDKIGWELLAWPMGARSCDLLHSLYFAAPIWPGMPVVVTVHDAISLHPEFQHSRSAGIYADIMRSTVRRAAAIITVSEHARQELAAKLDYPSERITVIPEAPDPTMRRVTEPAAIQRVRQRYRLPPSYVLYLGGTEARKNIETLVRAWAKVPPSEVRLVIVGRFHPDDPLFPNLPNLIHELGLDNRTVVVPFVDQADLAVVFAACTVFCYPSTYEGFGLPPIEAMACGAPVLAARASSLPEVLGDGADLLEPDDETAWATALERLLGEADARSALAHRGSEWVKRYSWEATAAQTVHVYSRVLGES